MDIQVVQTDCTEHSTPLLVAKVFQGGGSLVGPLAKIDSQMGGRISTLIQGGDFKAKEGQTLLLFPDQGTPYQRLLLVGLGEKENFEVEQLRRAAATALKRAREMDVTKFAMLIHHAELVSDRIAPADAGRAVAEGLVLGGYRFSGYKAEDEKATAISRVEILEKEPGKAAALREGVRVGAAMARGENFARDLGNQPGNVATPSYLGERAEEIASRFGMEVTILGPEQLREEGLEALLAVSRGSDEEPRLIVLEHRGGTEGDAPLMLVGKGLTFDAGGISIKPAAGMEDMKFDMCGGAAVLGAMHAVGELQIRANVVAIVPSSENLLSGAALKPGDIIRSHKGTTIEVINTDAEGRLILADALSWAKRFNPAAVIDAATLTGSCVTALGHHASAAMSNDEALLQEIRDAGDRVGERVWPLPMLPEYREQLKSDYADIKNSGGRPAGSITAGWFLREFIPDAPWVHLDIAGTAYGDGKIAYQSKGATGVPTRLFVDWILSRAG